MKATRRRKPTRKATRTRAGSIDYVLLLTATTLTMFGVLMVYNASVAEAYRDFSDKFYFAKQQLLWAGLGIGLMVVVSQLPVKLFQKVSVWAFGITLLLLFAVLVPSVGTKTLGARRWINLGSMNIQPAEIAKLTTTMYLASYFEKKRRFLPFAIAVSVVVGLILLEPDLGTAAVVAGSAIAVYFYAGASLSMMFALLGLSSAAAAIFIATSEYRRARVMTFLNPKEDPLGASYHIRQVLIALGSGGLLGLGLGKSRQKYEYIPAATTDSIFAIIAEEMGFLGALVLIAGFAFFIFRSFKIARDAPSGFARLLAGGVAAWLGIQIVVNLGTMVALIPLTGVPLPFISYGGSATIMSLIGVGVLLSVAKYAKHAR